MGLRQLGFADTVATVEVRMLLNELDVILGRVRCEPICEKMEALVEIRSPRSVEPRPGVFEAFNTAAWPN